MKNTYKKHNYYLIINVSFFYLSQEHIVKKFCHIKTNTYYLILEK